ncbi:unnamed protein product [Moneuplotes crassus]|uniref:Uncharacterized protein n=1 Tax=Euplotes crassus TaxID=5936 RepID=A0AAD1Y5U2_EUPCR|nr:unnamed protein product [Moneuplotes crassus]
METLDLSKTIFTKIGITNEILPFYGYAEQCRQLMTQLRSESRKLWNDDIEKWFKNLSQVKREIHVDNKEVLEYLDQHYRYAMFKIVLTFNKMSDVTRFYDFLANSKEGSISKAKFLEITQVNLPKFKKKYVMEEFITTFLECIGKVYLKSSYHLKLPILQPNFPCRPKPLIQLPNPGGLVDDQNPEASFSVQVSGRSFYY